jgi:hypothetical protein
MSARLSGPRTRDGFPRGLRSCFPDFPCDTRTLRVFCFYRHGPDARSTPAAMLLFSRMPYLREGQALLPVLLRCNANC